MFGRLIVTYRQRLGLTQEALAARTGLNVRSLRDLELGRVQAPRKSSVSLLADAFGLTGVERERFCVAAARIADDHRVLAVDTNYPTRRSPTTAESAAVPGGRPGIRNG